MKKIIERTLFGLLALLGFSSCNRTKTNIQTDESSRKVNTNIEEFRCIYGGPDMMFRQLPSKEEMPKKETEEPQQISSD